MKANEKKKKKKGKKILRKGSVPLEKTSLVNLE